MARLATRQGPVEVSSPQTIDTDLAQDIQDLTKVSQIVRVRRRVVKSVVHLHRCTVRRRDVELHRCGVRCRVVHLTTVAHLVARTFKIDTDLVQDIQDLTKVSSRAGKDPHGALGIVLLYGPSRKQFLMSEVPLHPVHGSCVVCGPLPTCPLSSHYHHHPRPGYPGPHKGVLPSSASSNCTAARLNVHLCNWLY